MRTMMNIDLIMLGRLVFGYRVTKPRVNNQNTQSLRQFRREVHQARRRAHMDAVEYQNKIEDEFLENHKKEVAKQHFKNECKFRSLIARHSFRMFEQNQKRRQSHQQHLERLRKYLHDQEVKKLNRIRIKKILSYESENYWLQGDNINQKIMAQNILPDYVGSTQYYHKLHSQALAYDNLDFDLLHKLSSTEETVKQKNTMLIPVFKQVITSIRQAKFSQLEKKQREYELTIINLRSHHQGNQQQLNTALQNAKQNFDKWVAEYKSQFNDSDIRRSFLKEKTKDLIVMMKKWKQYTDILGLTSTQIMKTMSEKDLQATVNAKKKILEKQFGQKKDTTFVDPVEEDTEDDEVTLQEYLVTNDTKKSVLESNMQQSNLELNSLLQQQESIFEQLNQQVEEQEENEKNGKNLNSLNLTQNIQPQLNDQIFEIDEGYRIYNQTTTSIEAMKEMYKDDEEMMRLLNLVGELTIDYPKLFKKIWESQML